MKNMLREMWEVAKALTELGYGVALSTEDDERTLRVLRDAVEIGRLQFPADAE